MSFDLVSYVNKRKNHTVIDLSNKGIQEIPPGLFDHCFLLKQLDLSNNQLAFLPPKLLNHCPNLKWLDMSSNEIRFIPLDFLENCKKLEHLNLGSNRIRILPPRFLENCKKLNFLNLTDNPSLYEITLPNHLNKISFNLLVDHPDRIFFYESLKGRL